MEWHLTKTLFTECLEVAFSEDEMRRPTPQVRSTLSPDEYPTEPVLLGEPLKVFGRPLRGVSHGGNEVDQTLDLIDQYGQEETHHKEECHHQSQVGEHYCEGPLDQPVMPLKPVDRRV